jgi:hypothetical protein
MIIGTSKGPQPIGSQHIGLWMDGVLYPDQPFVILREATVEEWDGDVNNPVLPPEAGPALREGRALFYEVSLD